MNYDSCSMKKVANEAAVRAGKPGSFAFVDVTEGDVTFKRMWVHLPGGHVGGLNLEPAPTPLPLQWPWNGSMTKPTINRPIQLRGRWCGEIKAGRMIGAAKEEAQPAVPSLPPPVVNPIRSAVSATAKRARTQ